MYYVYVIQSPELKHLYIGFSANLRQRIAKHQQSEHPGWRLVYYEAYLSEKDARRREYRLKHHGSGKRELKKRLEQSLQTVFESDRD